MTEPPALSVPAGTTVVIREVGPRDGLQAEQPLPVDARARLIDRLSLAGLSRIEAVAFVSPARVPSMAEPAEVLGAVERRPDVVYVGLVPNLRGAERALEAGVDAVSVTLSASERYSQNNVGRGRREAEDETARVIDFLAGRLPVDVVVSCSFGSPYEEEDIDADFVAGLVRGIRELGATVTLADTTGEADPAAVSRLIDATGADVGLHLHDTRHTALVNAYAALHSGVRRFDTSVAGLGGSPFAEGAAGNLATEDLVHLLGALGMRCGVDLDALLDVSRWLSGILGRPPASPLAAVGPARGAGRSH